MNRHLMLKRVIRLTIGLCGLWAVNACISAPLEDADRKAGLIPKHLLKLNEFIEMGDYADGDPFGFLVRDANLVALSDDAMLVFMPLRDKDEFRRSLIEALDSRSASMGAYVALNQLYPDDALQLLGASFYLTGSSTPKYLPLAIRTKTGIHVQHVPQRVFSDIAREYWTEKLLSRTATSQ